MATAGFILSTGRTSTQSIAAIAAKAYPRDIVEHEGLGPYYLPRQVYRRPRKFERVLGSNVQIQRKLIEIEDAVAGGRSYLDVGWPSFAWVPYLASRFGNSFRFAHLVRNPFEVAASLTTHGLFSGDGARPNHFQKHAMIHTVDEHVHYKQIAANGSEFGPFEQNLFHWLELNQFLIEQHDRDGFLGLFRFEDLYDRDDPALPDMLAGFLGEAEVRFDLPPVDRVQKRLKVPIDPPDPRLVDAVVELGVRLGYSEDILRGTLDVGSLNRRYRQRRL